MEDRTYKINFYHKIHGKQVQKTETLQGDCLRSVIEGLLADYDNVVISKDSTRYLNKKTMSREDSTYLDLCEHAT